MFFNIYNPLKTIKLGWSYSSKPITILDETFQPKQLFYKSFTLYLLLFEVGYINIRVKDIGLLDRPKLKEIKGGKDA